MEEYAECIKWKLYHLSDYIIQNDTLIYLPKNLTYAIGEYRTNNDNAFVCIPDSAQPPFYYIDILYIVACFISAIALILSLYFHWILPSVNTVYDSRPLTCHMICLFWFYVLELVFQLMGSHLSQVPGMCYFLGTWGQYALISAFCWLNVVTFNMWRHFHPQRILQSTRRVSCLKYTCQSLYGWMVPALLIIICNLLILAKSPLATTYNSRCLISMYKNTAQVISYYICESYALIINVVLIILTCVNLRRMSLGIAIANQGIHRQMFRMYMKLLLVTGVCWVLQVLEWATVPFKLKQVYWIVPDLLNALQGLILFLIYNCTAEIRMKLRQHYSKLIYRFRIQSVSARSSQASASSYI